MLEANKKQLRSAETPQTKIQYMHTYMGGAWSRSWSRGFNSKLLPSPLSLEQGALATLDHILLENDRGSGGRAPPGPGEPW